MTDHIPTGATVGARADTAQVFTELRRRWMDAKPGRNGTALCKRLSTRKQLVSSWATGTGGRRAPLWACMALCHDLRLELRMTPDGVVITRRRGRGADGPGTRADDFVVPWEGAD